MDRANTLNNILLALCLALSVTSCGHGSSSMVDVPKGFERTIPKKQDVYPLDQERRRVVARGRANCPKVQLVTYKGDVIRYHRPLKVNPFFRERLQHFELVVRTVAKKVYGRAPVAIRHYGGYVCRRISGRPHRMSEHGLGNAIDISGFEFGADATAVNGLKGGFRVVLKTHWDGRYGVDGMHARFLRELVIALAHRPDIFRGMLGPGAPGHDDHFHFDVGRSRFLKVKG